MNKQLISILSVAIAIGLAFGLYKFVSNIDNKNINPIQIVPDNAAIIIEAKHSNEVFDNLADHTFIQRLFLNSKITLAFDKIRYLDSLFQKNEIGDWFKKGQAVYSIHSFSNKSVAFFMAVQTLDEVNPENFLSFFQTNFPNRFKISKRKFNNQEIFDITDFKQETQFSIAFKSKLMMFSFDGSLVELSLVKLNKINVGLPEKDPLSFVNKSGDGLSVYINYKNIPDLLKSGTNENLSDKFNLLGSFGEKSVYTVKIEDEYVLLNGAAQTHETNFQLLDLLNSQAPVKNNLIPLLPEAINFCFSFNYNGYVPWFKNVHEYLSGKNLLIPYKKYVDSIETNLQIKFSEKMLAKFGNSVSLFSLDEPGIMQDSCFITAIEISDQKGFEQILDQMDQSFKNKYANDSLSTQSDTFGLVKKAYLGNAFKYFFTDLFEGQEALYYLKHQGYFFFANNVQILNALQQKWDQKSLLSESKSFQEFEENLAAQSNLELLINNDHAAKHTLSYLDKEWFSLFTQNMETIKRAQWIGFQFAGSLDKVFASQISIKFNLNKFDKTEQIWAIKLDSTLLIDPVVVFKKSMAIQVIMVQDALFQLYMIDKEGKILWKRKMDQKIISPFTEIDLLHNDRSQYVFNTSRSVYMIDENGKDLSGWPVWIPTGTKYPVNVCDFNQDGNYSIFASGIYYKISGYSAQGRLLPNWNPKDVWPNLKSPLSNILLGTKPLLCNLNEKGQLSFYTIQGQKFDEINLDSNFHWLDYQLANLDTGKILILAMDSNFFYRIQYESGKSKKIKKIDLPDYLTFKSVFNGSGLVYNVFLAKNKVLVRDESDKTIYQKSFSDSTLQNIKWINIGGTYKISYFDVAGQKLNLEDANGKAVTPFPMQINGPYSIGKLFFDTDDCLIYGDKGSQLFLYRIK